MKQKADHKPAMRAVAKAMESHCDVINNLTELADTICEMDYPLDQWTADYKASSKCRCIYSSTCEHCQEKFLLIICQQMHNDSGERTMIATGTGKKRQWVYVEGLEWNAAKKSSVTSEEAIQILRQIETFLQAKQRGYRAALKNVRNTIRRIQSGVIPACPELLQDLMFDEAA